MMMHICRRPCTDYARLLPSCAQRRPSARSLYLIVVSSALEGGLSHERTHAHCLRPTTLYAPPPKPLDSTPSPSNHLSTLPFLDSPICT